MIADLFDCVVPALCQHRAALAVSAEKGFMLMRQQSGHPLAGGTPAEFASTTNAESVLVKYPICAFTGECLHVFHESV